MTEARDADDRLLPDAERLTPLGRFLRSTSLDELPELINVLRGEMSLVGLWHAIFPDAAWMRERYGFESGWLLPYYHGRRLADLAFRRLST